MEIPNNSYYWLVYIKSNEKIGKESTVKKRMALCSYIFIKKTTKTEKSLYLDAICEGRRFIVLILVIRDLSYAKY